MTTQRVVTLNIVALLGQLVSPPDPTDEELLLRLAVARSQPRHIEPGVHLIDVIVRGRLGWEVRELTEGQYVGVTAHIEREQVEGEPTTQIIIADQLQPAGRPPLVPILRPHD
jgi:hypothetical protein